MNPYRPDQVEMTGPDPSGARRAARWREAWRGFWRYRAEEISAVFDEYEFLTVTVVICSILLAVFLFCWGMVNLAQTFAKSHCEDSCAVVSSDAVYADDTCFCLTDDGPRSWASIAAEL